MQDTNTPTIEKIGTIVFIGSLPSWNDFIVASRRHRMGGSDFTHKWLETGMVVTNQWLNTNYPEGFATLRSGVWVAIKVYRSNFIRRDLHNLFIKPILDAFTRAGLWLDDNEKVVPKVTFEYCGVDRENPRVEFEIYQEQEGL